MVAFIDAYRDTFGVEPICAQLPIAPSTYREHKAREADPDRQSPKVRSDKALWPSAAAQAQVPGSAGERCSLPA
jgi:hypothetical protein